jgi:hypothetical protein
MKLVSIVYLSGIMLAASTFSSCSVQQDLGKNAINTDTIRIGGLKSGLAFEIDFVKGAAHNHPTFAIWLEDMDQNYIKTLFVTKSIATGIYGHGPIQKEVWDNRPGPQKRPGTLPVWLHKRSEALNVPLLPDSTHPVLDGYTGATPKGNFVIKSDKDASLPHKVRILMEINQPWDWNEYWTNSLYDDPDYRTSCQPSLIYAVSIDLDKPEAEYYLNPIGHGQYAGKDGKLYTDLRTMTTALKIIDHVSVKLVNLQEK